MDATRVADLTKDDLKALSREALQELLWELEQEMPDPDEGLEFRPEVAEYLHTALHEKKRGTPLTRE